MKLRLPALLLPTALLLAALLSSRPGRSQEPVPTAPADNTPAADPRKGTLFVTVISHFDRPWEMKADDIQALRELTRRHPDIKWTHLYNPVAYSQPTPLRDGMEQVMKEMHDRHGAEIGLHLHMYRSLVEAAGVGFRDSPSLDAEKVEGSRDPSGYAVPMSAYTPDELRALLAWSLRTFETRALPRPRTFCAGFYATSTALQSALASLDFTSSAAAFPAGTEHGREYAPSWRQLAGWDQAIHHFTLPYPVSRDSILPDKGPPYLENSSGLFLEIPQTCKIDWMLDTRQLLVIVQQHLDLANKGRTTAICLALHETSAAEHLDKFDAALTLLDRHRAIPNAPSVQYVTASELRLAFLKQFPPDWLDRQSIEKIRSLGGTVFQKTGKVVEVILGNTPATDADLRLLGRFDAITDLSLEVTAVGDPGLASLAHLHQLEWLNLYRTRISDDALATIGGLPNLKHLPIGETRVSDAGLAHLSGKTQLLYLGLRGNRITDKGLAHLSGLTNLTGLHLGDTAITNKGLPHLLPLKKLQKLWLFGTTVSNRSLPVLKQFKQLEELHLYRTDLTIDAVQELVRTLPHCKIFFRNSDTPER